MAEVVEETFPLWSAKKHDLPRGKGVARTKNGTLRR